MCSSPQPLPRLKVRARFLQNLLVDLLVAVLQVMSTCKVWLSQVACRTLQQLSQLVSRHLTVAQNLGHQARSNDFTSVYRHNRAPSIGMFQDVMAAFDADDLKAGFAQRSDKPTPGHARESGHAPTQTR